MERGIDIILHSRDMDEHTPEDIRHDITLTYHNEDPDVSIYDLIHGVYTLLIGNTFTKQTVINGMKRFIEENEITQAPSQEF